MSDQSPQTPGTDAPAPPEPPVAPDAPTSATGGLPPAEDATAAAEGTLDLTPETGAPADELVERDDFETPEPEGDQAPHEVVDDELGHAQTAAYNEAVGDGPPTGEEPVTDLDGNSVPLYGHEDDEAVVEDVALTE